MIYHWYMILRFSLYIVQLYIRNINVYTYIYIYVYIYYIPYRVLLPLCRQCEGVFQGTATFLSMLPLTSQAWKAIAKLSRKGKTGRVSSFSACIFSPKNSSGTQGHMQYIAECIIYSIRVYQYIIYIFGHRHLIIHLMLYIYIVICVYIIILLY